MSENDLLQFAIEELHKTGIASKEDYIDGFVVKCSDVYPVYTIDYKNHLSYLQGYLSQFENLSLIGRHGLFRYCNSDLALLIGMTAGKNYTGETNFNLWDFHDDEDFLG